MNSDSQPIVAAFRNENDEGEYASPHEVEQAIRALTDADFVKLMIIARYFCRIRCLSSSVMEPEELLSEAVMKTLQMDKKWKKTLKLVKHLDRAMENISGHLTGLRSRIVSLPFPDGLTPGKHQISENAVQKSVADTMAEQEASQALLKSVFGEDQEALNVFVMRTEGFVVAEVRSQLSLNSQQYETVARRSEGEFLSF